MELHDILLKWLQTFDLKSSYTRIEDLGDGVALSEALNQIAPEWFTEEWVRAKIKTDTIGNWRIKVSNLKKILEKVVDYYQEAFNQNLSGFRKPDLMKIGESGDPYEIGRLLQLILGCAVNCSNKQEYIGRILAMDEEEQRAMMECIQEVDSGATGGGISLSASLGIEPHLEQLSAQLAQATQDRDQMAQRCIELDHQVSMLQEEKAMLLDEKKRLTEQIETSIESGSGTLRRQVEALKEELFKLESSRDDYRLKVEAQEKEMAEMESRLEELGRAAGEARALKDEVDVLRETADKVDKLEASLQSYKKKLEESADARRELKLLETKNIACYRHNIELEEEVRRLTVWKTQVEVYKKQTNELQERLMDETKRADKLQYEAQTTADKLASALREKDRLIVERDSLREANDELKCLQVQSSSEMVEGRVDPVGDGLASNTELRQKLVRLQHENNMLKVAVERAEAGGAAGGDGAEVANSLLEDTRAQLDKARRDLREANLRTIQLEGELKDACERSVDSSGLRTKMMEVQQQLARERQRAAAESEDRETLLAERSREVQALQERLAQRDQEIQEAEDKHKKYVEKAKSVVKAMDPGLNNQEVSLIRAQLLESQRELRALQGEMEAYRRGRDTEEKLMASAFHHLASVRNRESVEQRLASLGNGQSFLARQRQPTAKKLNTFNSK